MTQTDKTKPSLLFSWLALGATLAGISIIGVIEWMDLALTRGDLIGHSACSAISSFFNCYAVTSSPWSRFHGFPLALIGLWGYLVIFGLVIAAISFANTRKTFLKTALLLAFVFILADAGLLYVMLVKIQKGCPLCLATYGINAALVVFLWVAERKIVGAPETFFKSAFHSFYGAGAASVFLWVVLTLAILGIIAFHASVSFLTQGMPQTQVMEMARNAKPEELMVVQIAGAPTKGMSDAPVEIIEFSDFLCPACQKASRYNDIILAAHHDKVSITFKYYPWDMNCNPFIKQTTHPGACQVARAAVCAGEQGKFWEFHDKVFEKGPEYRPENIRGDLAALGVQMNQAEACMEDPRSLEAVKQSVQEGVRVGVTSTPSYFVNGVNVNGLLSPFGFNNLLPGFEAVREKYLQNKNSPKKAPAGS